MQGLDLNQRPSGYEAEDLSTAQQQTQGGRPFKWDTLGDAFRCSTAYCKTHILKGAFRILRLLTSRDSEQDRALVIILGLPKRVFR